MGQPGLAYRPLRGLLIGEYRFSDIHRGGVARSTAAPDQNELFGPFSVIDK